MAKLPIFLRLDSHGHLVTAYVKGMFDDKVLYNVKYNRQSEPDEPGLSGPWVSNCCTPVDQFKKRWFAPEGSQFSFSDP